MPRHHAWLRPQRRRWGAGSSAAPSLPGCLGCAAGSCDGPVHRAPSKRTDPQCPGPCGSLLTRVCPSRTTGTVGRRDGDFSSPAAQLRCIDLIGGGERVDVVHVAQEREPTDTSPGGVTGPRIRIARPIARLLRGPVQVGQPSRLPNRPSNRPGTSGSGSGCVCPTVSSFTWRRWESSTSLRAYRPLLGSSSTFPLLAASCCDQVVPGIQVQRRGVNSSRLNS